MAGDENCQSVMKCCIATSHTVTLLEEPQSSQLDVTMIIQVAKNQNLTGKFFFGLRKLVESKDSMLPLVNISSQLQFFEVVQ